MRHISLYAGVLIGLMLLVPRLNAQVSTSRPYEERQVLNLQGNFEMIGNTNIECVSGCPSPATTNNPPAVMGYVDIDSDATTVNSSSSTLNLPAGATVEWAFLYWGGVYESTFGGITNPPATMVLDEMWIMPPGSTTYQTITAQGHDTETSAFTGWNTFLAYADITSIVQSGGAGAYTGANIKLATGSAFTGPGGGWSMVVVYSDPSEKNRSISVWDGFQFFGFGANDNFTVTDLLTPSSGAFETHAAYFAFDGEVSSTGDYISINGTALSNALNPSNNTLNGTISEFGVDLGTRNPVHTYNWGVDMDIFDASGLVPNGATSLDVELGSSSEGIWSGVFLVTNEISFPVFSEITFSPDCLFLGDTMTIEFTLTNPSGGVPLTNVQIVNNLPSGLTLADVPNATSSCGATVSAPPGGSSITYSNFNLAAGASCDFSYEIKASDIGNYPFTILSTDFTNDQNIPILEDTVENISVCLKTVITNRRITYRAKPN